MAFSQGWPVVTRLEGNERCLILPFEFGETVNVSPWGLAAIVTGYLIRKGYAEVEVAWFSNGDAKSAWFPDWRVERAA
jgi:hypothetical protein